MKKSFLKTGISNKMDGTEDDLLWEEDTDKEDEKDEEDEEPTWDTDVAHITQEEMDELFGDSDEEEFDGF